jgi:uncharacterized protein with HEPN domain
MPPKKADPACLLDMLTAAEAVARYSTGKVREDLDRDEMFRDAIERRLEIIGEAARGVSDSFQTAHPEIAWKKIMATRHIIAHDYDAVNYDILWRIITVHVPELIDLLRPLIPPLPPDPEP